MNTKKKISKALTLILASVMAFSVVGCGGGGGTSSSVGGNSSSAGGTSASTGGEESSVAKPQLTDPETRPLVMSISTPDGVFNPFFSTSAYDSSIVGMTQISMLDTDKLGNLVWGYDEPVVTLDYATEYNEDEDQTTYKFILKNGIKFSDGKPLTIKDVLFNLYTYLDPAYTGSATMYSTKIVGLDEYRKQDPYATESGLATFEQSFYDDAVLRVQRVIDYVKIHGRGVSSDDKPEPNWDTEDEPAIEADYATVAKEFKKELETDWNTSVESKESYVDWNFTEAWQIFLLNDGGYTELLQVDETGKYVKDDEGNYKLNQEEADAYALDLQAYMAENTGMTKDEAAKAWAIALVYDTYFPGEITRTNANLFEQVASGWATADVIRDQFAAEAKSEYFEQATATGLRVPTIKGIDGTATTNKMFDGTPLNAQHEMLTITIKGIDPKAQYNFAFTVAPMHYYSTTNYEGVDYINTFDQSKGQFGLKYGSIDFMNEVINAPSKVGLPMGAGMYKASNSTGTGTVTADNFFVNNIVHYERNTYFETLGTMEAGAEVHNAKIKYVRYKVVESDQIINALANGDIDYGDPSATQENIAVLDQKNVAHKEVYTSGYGYVGINPRFIPDVTIRRAIIKAMDTSIITKNYYKGGLADLIYRPMSTTSWAYPKDATVFKNAELGLDYSFDNLGNDIEKMVQDAGYEKNAQGIYTKELSGFGTVTCDYTFTIAGSSTDHPATAMFNQAAKILNAHGFKIKVVTSQTALSDLTTGKLTVWAAAWSSAIDPDMYQVYHKDSKATSVNNWGYKQIKAKFNTVAYADEFALINELSDLIDQGRETNDQEERKLIYADALDKIMELAVEMPTYQRKDMSAYNESLLDVSTMTPDEDLTPYNGLISKMWQLNYN
ncbi:MAG: hypothetical protein IKA40_01620 [Clostridia bacterium]|nr:hypothetical protein [Clostridia bacterium]